MLPPIKMLFCHLLAFHTWDLDVLYACTIKRMPDQWRARDKTILRHEPVPAFQGFGEEHRLEGLQAACPAAMVLHRPMLHLRCLQSTRLVEARCKES